jgi:hypothetical protein
MRLTGRRLREPGPQGRGRSNRGSGPRPATAAPFAAAPRRRTPRFRRAQWPERGTSGGYWASLASDC